jgi:glyoxylase-like metal-dependent hydrolase (beta-lactamase superfamily II)
VKLKSRGCNVYLIKDGDSAYLIDAGTDAVLISKQLKELDGIIITHAHFDHYAAASALQKEFGCPVYVHSEDIPFILGEKRMKYSGFLGLLARVGERIFRAEPPEDLKGIEELNINATIIHTPGHTPGSICILHEGNLYCGDLMRGGNGLSLSPKSFCSNYSQYIDSVRKISELDFSGVYPGHGSAGTRADYEKLLRKI